MKKNMGTTDRNIRILLAVSVAVLYYLNVITGPLALVLILILIIGILLATSFISFCPLYLPFGFSTRKKPKKTKHEVHPS